ncbi:hypothetical protein IJ847_02950 [Candidatus Saccharibacteria bacterium]|nr:hypothetical protein [Candidatus Saccharibacteria bacterium]
MNRQMMAEIYEITMAEYNKVLLGRTRFMESWEYSVKKKTRSVVVRLSKEEVKREAKKPGGAVLDKCKARDKDMSLCLAEILSYDAERNTAKMRLISRDSEINNLIVVGAPLCSQAFFQRFWNKHLRKYGDMKTALMS